LEKLSSIAVLRQATNLVLQSLCRTPPTLQRRREIVVQVCDQAGLKDIREASTCEISSSHGGEYEAQYLLGCTAVLLIRCRPMFQRCMLPPSSGRRDDGGSMQL
jgi:hypothetical protein